MSYEARNAGTNGLGILGIMAHYDDIGLLLVEASPIYQTLDRSWSISGSYEDFDYEYDYNYSITLPQFTREPLSTNIQSIEPMVTDDGIANDTLSADIAEYGTPNANKMYIALTPGVSGADFLQYFSPLYQSFEMVGAVFSQPDTVIGVRTKKSDSSTTDLKTNLFLGGISFGGSTTGARRSPTRLSMSASQMRPHTVDITSWRDFRGTYTSNQTDNDGITTTAEWTLG